MFDSESGPGRDESLFAERYSRNSPGRSSRRGRIVATRTTFVTPESRRDELLGGGGAGPRDGDRRERDLFPQRRNAHLAGRDSARQRGRDAGHRLRGGRADEPTSTPDSGTGSPSHDPRRGPDRRDGSGARFAHILVWRSGRAQLPRPSRVVVFRGVPIQPSRDTVLDRWGVVAILAMIHTRARSSLSN